MFVKILVAIDGSDTASHALMYGAGLADEQKAELVIVTVVPSLTQYFVEDLSLEYYPRLEEDIETFYTKMVEGSVVRIREAFPGLVVSSVVRRGRPVGRIVEVADELGVDLIVVGNRGRSGVISWMLGSTSRGVVDSCTVPVIVVKDKKFCKL